MTTLSFEQFKERFASEFDIKIEETNPETRLAEDLGFDSLRMAELGIALEEAGLSISEDFLEIRTLGDVYRACMEN
jgi:acyl carrier protein